MTIRPVIAACFTLLLPLSASAAIYTVTTAADSGPGSLRQAILDANATASEDVIQFAIGSGPQTINLSSPLPAITTNVKISGNSQPGYAGKPLIELNGAATPAGTHGLVLSGFDAGVLGIAVNGFPGHGIVISDTSSVSVSTTWVGLGLDGSTAKGNGGDGIHLIDTSTASIVEVSAGANGGAGVSATRASEVTISFSRIGTDATGMLARPNADGIVILDSKNIGINGNQISSNGRGVVLRNVDLFYVSGSNIGLNASGGPLGNSGAGIHIDTSYGEVGLFTGVTPNEIAWNGKGVVIVGASTVSIGSHLNGNSIHDNVGLGIDLNDDGVTVNDPLDADAGPNQLQNHPILTSAVMNGNALQIQGSLHTTPFTTVQIHLFASAACDPSGFGEGGSRYRLASSGGTTDAAGNLTFTRGVVPPPPGMVITATANAGHGTSEFSNCIPVVGPGGLRFSASSYQAEENARGVTITVERTVAYNAASIDYFLSAGTATPGQDYENVSGTLTWTEGDSSPRSFVVPFFPDVLIEPTERFYVHLRNGRPVAGVYHYPQEPAPVDILDSAAATAEVPTLSEWALLLLAAAIGMLALRRL